MIYTYIHSLFPAFSFQSYLNYYTARKGWGEACTVKISALSIIKQVYLNRSTRNVLALSIF